MRHFIMACFLAVVSIVSAQDNNSPVSINGEPMIIGHTTYENILNHFDDWRAVADTVTVDSAVVQQFKAIREPVHILLFLGTWCGDSRRGVPPFMAVFRAANNPNLKLDIIGVTRDKEDPEGLAPRYGIERVPTFVILKDGKEIARLVEFPQKTFAQDFIDVLTKPESE